MHRKFALFLSALVLAGCAGASGFYVNGVGSDDLLKLREGPGFDYPIIVGLPNGTRLTRHNCVTRERHLWCRVTLTDNPQMSGYVASNYMAAL